MLSLRSCWPKTSAFRPLPGGLLFMDECVFISSAVSPGPDLGRSPRFPWSISTRGPLKTTTHKLPVCTPRPARFTTFVPGIRRGMLLGKLQHTCRKTLDWGCVRFHILKSTAAASCGGDQTPPHHSAPLLRSVYTYQSFLRLSFTKTSLHLQSVDRLKECDWLGNFSLC